MRTELPGLVPLTPPTGGRLRLRQALEVREERAAAWLPAVAAVSAAFLIAILVRSPEPSLTLSGERLRDTARLMDANGWVALGDASEPVQVWVALPSASASGDGG